MLDLGAQQVQPIVGLQPTDEFRRIQALPERDWLAEIERDDLYLKMSAYYRTPWGQQTFHKIQAAALAELHDLRGLIGSIAAGDGKTLITFMAPTVVQAERALLLVPANLIEKTKRDFKMLSHHWLSRRGVTIDNYEEYHPNASRFSGTVIESYNMLSVDGGQSILDLYKPTMIMADECHKLKNMGVARTKRFVRYMRQNPDTMFVGLSGSITARSIRNFWHLAFFALRHHMPLPRIHAELERWADAIDEKKTEYSPRRQHAGAIFEFASEEDKEELRRLFFFSGHNPQIFNGPEAVEIARRAIGRRLNSAPGFIVSKGENVSASLQIRKLEWKLSPKVKEHLKVLRERNETPNGDILLDGAAGWSQARELACDFYYRWEPPAPAEWLKRRKKWMKRAREFLSYRWPDLDSLGQIEKAVSEGRINHVDARKEYAEWLEIRDTFEINSVAEWVSDSTLHNTLNWMHKNPGSIVWVEHRAFGFKLSELSGVGFCTNGGFDQRGVFIDDYAGRTVIASIASNREGRNLQAWHKNLVVSPPPSGEYWEQMLARTHRPGQREETVFFDWVGACPEQTEGFEQAMRDARYVQSTLHLKQRLLYADHV